MKITKFSSPSGGDQFISRKGKVYHGFFHSFRLLLAEISLYQKLVSCLLYLDWCFRLLLAEISLYHRRGD